MSRKLLIMTGIALAMAAPTTWAQQPPAQAPSPTTKWNCYRNQTATVVGTEKTDSVGTKFLIRKTTPNAQRDCEIDRRKTDVPLGTDGSVSGDAPFFYIRLIKSFLILDSGTGPDRTLVIYDVPKVHQLLSAGYSVGGLCDPTTGCNSDDFSIDDKGLTFWRQISDTPTAQNCKDYADFMKTTGSAAIEEKSFFNFTTMKVEGSSTKRCSIRQ